MHAIVIALTAAALLAAPCARGGNPDKKLEFDAARPLLTLHTPPVRQYGFEDLDRLLRLESNQAPHGRVPVTIYIHGRGNEPQKSFANTLFTKGYLIPKIEQYGTLVLGLNWNSKADSRCDRPVDRARSAAGVFAQLVDALRKHRVQNLDYWTDRPLTLLVHSMGSFVVEAAVQQSLITGDPVFDRLIVTGSDAAATSHLDWLASTSVARERFVFTNPQDNILAKSRKCETEANKESVREVNSQRKKKKLPPLAPEEAPLRLGQLSVNGDAASFVPEIVYVQVEAQDRHRYFTKTGQLRNEAICRTFEAAFRGTAMPLRPEWSVNGSQFRYRLPTTKQLAADTFGGPSCFPPDTSDERDRDDR